MNMMLGGIIRCGKPARGGPCMMRLRGGKCPIHRRGVKQQIAERNRKANANRVANHPDEWRAHQSSNGLKTWRTAAEGARLWRRNHPSEPERWVIEILMEHLALDVSYDREYVIADDPRAVDFAFPDQRCVIEVWGWDKADEAFGETEPRAAKMTAKLEWLTALGWTVHIVYAAADRTAEAQRLIEFLQAHHLSK